MESVANFTSRRHHHHQLPLTLHHRRPSISKPISSLSFTTSSSSLLPSLKISSFSSSIKASFSNSPSQIPNSQHNTPISGFRTTLIVAVTAAAVFLSQLNLKPVLASTPVSAPPPPATVESKSESDPETESGYDADPEEEEKEGFVTKESEPAVAKTKIGSGFLADPEMEKNFEEKIASNPKDIKALRILLAIKMKGKKWKDAVEVLDKLLVLDPDEEEWPLLKATVQSEAGDHEASMKLYHGIISKNPLQIEAYLGLLSAGFEMKSVKGLVEIEEKIKEGLQKAKRSKKKSLVREISLLLGEVLICKNDYESALTIYKDLIKEEPRDFLPYMAQVRLYTLLKNDVEAEASLEKFRRLVPEGDPLREVFENCLREGKLALQEEANAKLYSRR